MKNTVMGIPEETFRGRWLQLLWMCMARTGKGYRRDPAGNRPRPGAARWYGERRKDKPGTTKLSRSLALQRSIAR